jgi:spermidine/putrescine transport system ATP-binding protein
MLRGNRVTLNRAQVDTLDIQFIGVSKHFDEVVALDHVDLAVRRGSFHSFLGPSGCGKTTSLRLIAGFDQPSAGRVLIGAEQMVGVPAHKRPVNMVFQHYALFPHMNVADNIAYGLRQRAPRPAKSEIVRQVDESLELVRLPGFGQRQIWELSGGQQQRVALARALINRPTVLLLDEPLAALDRKLRREMQMELQTLQREVGITFLLVTHDQEEALSMSDTISIMRQGRITQTASPSELYDAPVNRYVADFVGESNFFSGTAESMSPAEVRVRTGGGPILSAPPSPNAPQLAVGEPCVVAVRPEVIHMIPEQTRTDPEDWEVALAGRISNRIYLGDQSEFRVTTPDLGEVLVRSAKTSQAVSLHLGPGDAVRIGWRNTAGLVLLDD